MDVSVPQERIFERTREQLDEVFSWVTKEIVGVVRLMPQERIQQRTADEIVVSVAHIVQVGTIIPQERLLERRVEQIGDIFVHRVGEELVEVVQTFSQERIHRCSEKQIVDFPVAHVFECMMKDIFCVAGVVLQECLQRTVEEMGDVPVSQMSNAMTEILLQI